MSWRIEEQRGIRRYIKDLFAIRFSRSYTYHREMDVFTLKRMRARYKAILNAVESLPNIAIMATVIGVMVMAALFNNDIQKNVLFQIFLGVNFVDYACFYETVCCGTGLSTGRRAGTSSHADLGSYF